MQQATNDRCSNGWRQQGAARDRLELRLNNLLQQLAGEFDQDIQVSGCLFLRNIRTHQPIAFSFIEDRIYAAAGQRQQAPPESLTQSSYCTSSNSSQYLVDGSNATARQSPYLNGGNDQGTAATASLHIVKNTSGAATAATIPGELITKLTQDVRRSHQVSSRQQIDRKPSVSASLVQPGTAATVSSNAVSSTMDLGVARALQQKIQAAATAAAQNHRSPLVKHIVRRKVKREYDSGLSGRICKREAGVECGWAGPYPGPLPDFVQPMEPLDLTQLYESFRVCAGSNEQLDPPLGDPKQFVRLMTRRVLFNDSILRLSTTSGGNEFPPLNPERMACLYRLFTELHWGRNECQADWQEAKKSIRQYCKYLRLRTPLSNQEREFCKQLWLRGQSIV